MDWTNLAARIGKALGEAVAAVDPDFGDRLRASEAAKHGTCRDCGAPLGGPSPSRICQPCHAARVLARGLGGSGGGET